MTSETRQWTTEQLEARKADLQYLAQMKALEGLQMSEAERDEFLRIEKELEDRKKAEPS